MIVYRKVEEGKETLSHIDRLKSMVVEAASAASVDTLREAALDLLMEWGVFESALVDAISPDEDDDNDAIALLRRAALLTGRILHASIRAIDHNGHKGLCNELMGIADRLKGLKLPESVTLREPEGYAHYGLYPELYMEAARRLSEESRPAEAVCIGLRSIGTSLSAAASAALAAEGCSVESLTLRPRGHPFKRYIQASRAVSRRIQSLKGRPFLIFDEGPGLSGTSFGSTVKFLSSLGIPEKDMVLFPSWEPDGSAFFSEEAKGPWGRLRKYTADFDSVFVKSGRLSRGLKTSGLVNISGGGWRPYFYRSEEDYPAVNAHHEKRKYVAIGAHSEGEGEGEGRAWNGLVLRFAGLGRFGRSKYERALRLSASGLTQRAASIRDGFMATEFVHGRPVAGMELNQVLLDEMARYVAFIDNNMDERPSVSFDEMEEMIRRNTTVGLGGKWTERLSALSRFRPSFNENGARSVDGRMLPNEWLLTPRGYVKADSFDHHADQFFPRCQDIAWDLSGAIVEFNLSPMEEDYFLSRFLRLSRDRSALKRLQFYKTAYLAYRLGYSAFSAEELKGTKDGEKFKALNGRYALRLKHELLAL